MTTHLGRIYGKLGVNSRVGAVIEAARSGLVTVRHPERVKIPIDPAQLAGG